MRKAGQIPFNRIVDYTRTMYKPDSHDSLEDAINETARLYRRNIWPMLGVRAEVWTEKETLTGALGSVTAKYDVPLMPTRGYPSLSFVFSSAEQIEFSGDPTYLYYFGDHDPSGADIAVKVEEGLRTYAPNSEITFERLAVTEAQIDEYQLLTRPTKKSDSRSRSFTGDSVEVDAIPPNELRRLCREAIESHIPVGDLDYWNMVKKVRRISLKMFSEEAYLHKEFSY